jgi:hypothetical protein
MSAFDVDGALREARVKDFGRVLFSLGANRGRGVIDAEEYARARFGDHVAKAVGESFQLNKAAVDPSLSGDSDFDAFAPVAAAFLGTITDQFIGAQINPARVGFAGQRYMVPSVAASASWVGNGRAKPVTRTQWAGLALPVAKVEASIVVPQDAFVMARADLTGALTAELQRACVDRLNATFASASAATTDAPAGIGADATTVASTGATTSAIIADVSGMVGTLTGAGITLTRAYWIASDKAAARLDLENIARNGMLAGRPLLSCAGAVGLMLVSGQHVALAINDVVDVRRSEQATIEMSDDPEADTGTVVSLFQKNLVALIAEVKVAWRLIGPSDSTGKLAAVVLTGASWA